MLKQIPFTKDFDYLIKCRLKWKLIPDRIKHTNLWMELLSIIWQRSFYGIGFTFRAEIR